MFEYFHMIHLNVTLGLVGNLQLKQVSVNPCDETQNVAAEGSKIASTKVFWKKPTMTVCVPDGFSEINQLPVGSTRVLEYVF